MCPHLPTTISLCPYKQVIFNPPITDKKKEEDISKTIYHKFVANDCCEVHHHNVALDDLRSSKCLLMN